MSLEYITITSAITAYISIPGYMMDKTTNVFLSSSTVKAPGSLSAINNFTTNPLVSSILPAVSGYNYPHFQIADKNHVNVYIYGLSGTGLTDIIVYGQAGYSKLSDRGYLIKSV
jgi:hypothetical protein